MIWRIKLEGSAMSANAHHPGLEQHHRDAGGLAVTIALQDDMRRSSVRPEVRGFFDARTCSVQYVVSDPAAHRCAIIDPVLDFDERSGSTATRSADAILDYVRRRDLTVDWILDTHPHADHFSAAGYLKDVTGAPTAIGERVVDVQRLWKALYNLPNSFPTDGSQWDHLFADGESFQLGRLHASIIFSPGHTLASITYVIGDAAFVHDTLFMPDGGTARADFPGGNAHHLWQSIQRILSFPDETRLFAGHDYQPDGRPPAWESTVAQQKAANVHVKGQDELPEDPDRRARQRRMGLEPRGGWRTCAQASSRVPTIAATPTARSP
jgi:glyoxylase-like metal-dependent hydrolase (beta-lactamase superfamily II)